MARLPRCILLLVLIQSIIAPVQAGILTREWIPLKQDCLDDVLSIIANQKKLLPSERVKLEGAAYYNDQIFKKFEDIPKEKWDEEIAKTIDHYAAYNLDFHAPSFKRWLKDNPLEPQSNSTIGGFLKQQNKSFVKKYPEGKIDVVVNELANDFRKIAKECGTDVACNEIRVAATLQKNKNKLCFMKAENRNSALKSMITGIAFANAGYAMNAAGKPDHDYQWDLTLTNLIWTPIMTELGCRSTLGGGNIGSKVELNKKIYRSTEWWSRAGNQYINYMILSPLSNATYVAFHTAKMVAQGKTEWKDVKFWDLTKQVASLSLYDAIWPTTRMVLITDPLYMKGVPGLNKYLNQHWSKMPATAATYTLDWGSRLGLSYLNSTWVDAWTTKSDQWWDTKFNGEKKHKPDGKTLENKNPSLKDYYPTSTSSEENDTLPLFK